MRRCVQQLGSLCLAGTPRECCSFSDGGGGIKSAAMTTAATINAAATSIKFRFPFLVIATDGSFEISASLIWPFPEMILFPGRCLCFTGEHRN